MAKFSFLLGFGAGYVLGAKAGRERYEQILGLWSDAKDNPQLQGLAGMAQARADDVVSSVKEKMGRDTGPAPAPARSTGTTTLPPATTTEAPDLTALPADPPPVG
ncbi:MULTISPECIES: YtxH domain-containing protein [unclassified Geodermatophilus]